MSTIKNRLARLEVRTTPRVDLIVLDALMDEGMIAGLRTEWGQPETFIPRPSGEDAGDFLSRISEQVETGLFVPEIIYQEEPCSKIS